MSISRARNSRATSASLSGAHILETVKRLDDPRAHRAAVVAAEGNPRHLESRAVMAFDQAGDQFGGGMLMEIRRQIGDADAVMGVTLRRSTAARPVCGT